MSVTKRFVPATAILLMSLVGITTLRMPPMAAVEPTPQPTPSAKPMPMSNFNPVEDKILEQLNLTTEQKQKIQSLNDKYQSQMKQGMQSAMQVSKDYQQIMNSDTATNAQIRDKYRQMQEALQQMSNANLEHQLAVRNVLTVEQRKQKAAVMNDPAKIQEIIRQLQSERKVPSAPSRMPVQPQRSN